MASSSSSSSKEASSMAEATIGTCEISDSVGVNVGENPITANPDPGPFILNLAAGSSPSSCHLNAVADLMEKGSRAFQDRDFATAAKLFHLILHTLIENNAEFADEFVPAYFKYGLALQAPIQIEDDLMTEAVPMEADYLLTHNERGPHDGIKCNQSKEELESAWAVLLGAWSCVEKQPGDSVEKVDILSALGEVALKKGNCDSYKHYQEALSILERLVEPDNQRIAHLNFKICLCMANCYKITEAIEYCDKAMSVCKNRIQRLTDELKSSSALVNVKQEPSSLPDVGPSLLKKDEVAMLDKLSREFEEKLLILEQRFNSSPPPTPGFDSLNKINQEITSPDGTSGEQNFSTLVSASNQPGISKIESPTDSTAHINERDIDVAANGADEVPSLKTYTRRRSLGVDQQPTLVSVSNQPGISKSESPTDSTAHISERDIDVAANGADEVPSLKTYTRRRRKLP